MNQAMVSSLSHIVHVQHVYRFALLHFTLKLLKVHFISVHTGLWNFNQ